MTKLVFGTVFFFGLVNFAVLLHAQGSVTLDVCNTGTVDIDAFVSPVGGAPFNSHIGPATCATVAESKGATEPAYVGLAFTDSRGQYGAARRFDGVPSMGVKPLPLGTRLAMGASGESVPTPPNVLSEATGKTIQYRNVSVPLQLLFQPRVPECISTGTSRPDQGRIYVGGTYCEELGYTLTVEVYPDTREIRLYGLPVGGAMSANPPYRFSEKTAVNWAAEEAGRKAREGQPVNWSDLLPALRRTRYGGPGLLDVLPRYIIVRGTVSSVEVTQKRVDATTTIAKAEVTFRESPFVKLRADWEPYSEFTACTDRLDILQERFGADFRTSMIGKAIEVQGDTNGGGLCRGQRGAIRVFLAHQVRPVPSAQFAADVRVWVPAPVAAPPPPRAMTNAEIEASITSTARNVAAKVERSAQSRLSLACAEQSAKAHAANPRNAEAINKEYYACKAAAEGEGAKQEGQKAHDCALQVLKGNPAWWSSGTEGTNAMFNALMPCYNLHANAPRAAPAPTRPVASLPTTPVAPRAAPIPSTIAAPAPAPTSPPQTPAPPQASVPVAQDSAAAAAAARARAAEQQRATQEAQQRNLQMQACMQQAAKDHSDGGRSDPQGSQKAIMACLQLMQAPAAPAAAQQPPAQPSK